MSENNLNVTNQQTINSQTFKSLALCKQIRKCTQDVKPSQMVYTLARLQTMALDSGMFQMEISGHSSMAYDLDATIRLLQQMSVLMETPFEVMS